MADSVTAGVALGASASIAVGLSPDPLQVITWLIVSLIGAILGFGISPKTTAGKAVVRGLAGVLASVVFGALAGEVFALSRLGTAAAIIAVGTFLHLAIARFADRIGAIVDAGLNRVGVKVESDK